MAVWWRSLFVSLMLLNVSLVDAADWQFVGANDVGKYYIDRTSVHWQSKDVFNIMTNVIQRNDAELQTKVQIDCAKDSYSYLTGRETREGKLQMQFDKPKPAERIAEGSMPHELKLEYCDPPEDSKAVWQSVGKSSIAEVFYDSSSIKQSSDAERFIADTKVEPFSKQGQTFSRMLFNCPEKTFIVLKLSKVQDGKLQQIFDKPQPPSLTSKTATLDKLAGLFCNKPGAAPALSATEETCSDVLERLKNLESRIEADVNDGGMDCKAMDSYLQQVREINQAVEQYSCPIAGLESFSQEIRKAGCK